MRTIPYNFTGQPAQFTETTETKEETIMAEPTTETKTTEEKPEPVEASAETKEAAKVIADLLKAKMQPEPGFFEKYRTMIIVLVLAAVAFFVWKFKIVSRTAQAVTSIS